MPKITRRNNQSSSLSSEPLIDWLKKRGYWVPYSNIDNGGKKQPLTHVFLNGGKASVPDSARREFNEKYVDSLLSGHDQFAVERTVGDVFKMFVDIDIKSPQMTISSPHDDGGRANGYTAAVQKTSKEDFVKEVAFTVLKHMPLSKTCGATLSFRVANDKTKKRKRADGEGEGEGEGEGDGVGDAAQSHSPCTTAKALANASAVAVATAVDTALDSATAVPPACMQGSKSEESGKQDLELLASPTQLVICVFE
jgi:hypothetical protein